MVSRKALNLDCRVRKRFPSICNNIRYAFKGDFDFIFIVGPTFIKIEPVPFLWKMFRLFTKNLKSKNLENGREFILKIMKPNYKFIDHFSIAILLHPQTYVVQPNQNIDDI